MERTSRPFLVELLWLTIALFVTVLISLFMLGVVFMNSGSDVQLHDTYVVFSTPTMLASAFLLVTFLFFFLREIRRGFNSTLSNAIILVSGLLLIILTAVISKDFASIGNSLQGTAYPPLSSLPHSLPIAVENNSFINVVSNVLTVLQLIITVALLYVSFRWGRKEASAED